MAYDLPSWLQSEPASEPWKALVSGAQAGSQIGSNILRSRALSEERRQFDIQQERASQFDTLRKTLLAQESQLAEIKINTLLRDRQEEISAESAYQKVARLFADHKLAGIAGTDASEARLGYTIANDPTFYRHPGSKDLLADMFLSRKTADVARQRDESNNDYLERIALQEAERTARNRETIAGRQDVADTRAETDIEKAHIAAKSKVDAALVSASKWKDHSRFAAFKDASAAIKLQIDPVKDPDNYAKAVQDIYNKLLPSGEPNAWDSGGGTIPVPVTMPKFIWDKEGMKPKPNQ